MKFHPTKLWIVVFGLGWFFDFLFWQKEPGVNFAVFTVLCLAGAFYLLVSGGLRPNRNSLLLLPLLGFFAAVTFFRTEPMTAFLASVLALFCMAVLAMTYLGGRWVQYAVSDYVVKFLHLIGSVVARPITFTGEVNKAQAEAGVIPSRRSLWPVIRGIIIALPIIAIFASLLSSADAVFSQKLDDFIRLFELEKLPEYIFRFIYILVIGYALAGVILHAASASNDEKLAADDKPIIPAFLGFTEAGIVLGSVLALFIAFVVIQFQYFFGGQANIHLDGYTYSEYARRGFGELVAVAFFTLLMLLILSGVTKRGSETQRRVFSALGISLVALVLVMLFSAYQRLVLYEAAYGFSRLRTYTHVVLIWIGLLLVATMILEMLRKERYFALAALIAGIGFAVTLPVLNVDAFIVRQNIARAGTVDELALSDCECADLDSGYFLSLSDDAVPALVDAYQSPSVPASVKDQVGAALACIRYERSLDERPRSWQSFHLSRFQADQALETVDSDLEHFTISDTSSSIEVTTPLGEETSCSVYYMD
jgi:hypothetical protein